MLCLRMVEYIQCYLMKKLEMKQKWVPLRRDNDGHKGANNIFVSSAFVVPDNEHVEDFKTNTKGCLVLIQGTGPVRAGYFPAVSIESIWSRYCCINEPLAVGSVFPYVEWAQKQGFSCIVFNPNLNTDPLTEVPSSSVFERTNRSGSSIAGQWSSTASTCGKTS